MPLRPMLPTVLLAALLSIVVAVFTAARGAPVPLGFAVGLFGVQVMLTLWRINAPAGASATQTSDWALSNTLLSAIVYGWGAAAMFSIYGFSGLHWRHWWQYGAGMALLAAFALVSARYLATRQGNARASAMSLIMAATVAQLTAIIAALVYLVGSGALHTQKGDWAANPVFLAGGLLVGAISVVSLIAYRRAPAATAAGV